MNKAVGLDFGTTNSALAVANADGSATLAQFKDNDKFTTTFRSILYFNEQNREASGQPIAIAGPAAINAYLDAESSGRLIQSVKSYLASKSFTQTKLFSYTYTLEDLISIIVGKLRIAAQEQFGDISQRVVVGRPVRFVGAESPDDETMAIDRLRTSIQKAGFKDVLFEYEPVAAAYYYEQHLDHDELVLIGDFGGGTSDFSLIQLGPSMRKQGAQRTILGTEGVPIAGDTFDSRIVKNAIAPKLGAGSSYRSFGKTLTMPAWIYEKLARWHFISFLKTSQTLETLRQLKGQAVEKDKIDALIYLIKEDLGYQLYRSVERTKVELSAKEISRLFFNELTIDIDELVKEANFEQWIEPDLTSIANCVDRLLKNCNLTTKDVDSVFLTGGSSFVPAVRRYFAEKFNHTPIRGGEELTTVAKGLSLRALVD